MSDVVREKLEAAANAAVEHPRTSGIRASGGSTEGWIRSHSSTPLLEVSPVEACSVGCVDELEEVRWHRSG